MWALRILSRFLAMVGTIPRRKDGTVHRKLADLFEWVISANPQRADGVVAFDVVVDAETGIWVRVFVPAQVLHTRTFLTFNLELMNWKL